MAVASAQYGLEVAQHDPGDLTCIGLVDQLLDLFRHQLIMLDQCLSDGDERLFVILEKVLHRFELRLQQLLHALVKLRLWHLDNSGRGQGTIHTP